METVVAVMMSYEMHLVAELGLGRRWPKRSLISDRK